VKERARTTSNLVLLMLKFRKSATMTNVSFWPVERAAASSSIDKLSIWTSRTLTLCFSPCILSSNNSPADSCYCHFSVPRETRLNVTNIVSLTPRISNKCINDNTKGVKNKNRRKKSNNILSKKTYSRLHTCQFDLQSFCYLSPMVPNGRPYSKSRLSLHGKF